MDPMLIGTIGIALMVILIMLGMPVGWAMVALGFFGVAALKGFPVALPSLYMKFFSLASDYSFTVLPLFVLMGFFADISGLSEDLYLTAEKWLRKLPGGLAIATIVGCAAFAAVTGSSIANAATMGAVALPQMKKQNYDEGLAGGSIAAGGTLGFLIPPSTAFVIYGVITQQSIGQLLIAGLLPGSLLAVTFIIIIVARVKFKPSLAPPCHDPVDWNARISSLKNVWGVILVFVFVTCSLLFGIATPTEAGAIGAFVLLIFTILRRRLSYQNFYQSLMKTSLLVGMIFIILVGGFLSSDFLAMSQLTSAMVNLVRSAPVSPYLILALIAIIYLVLGCFVDSIPMMILTVPAFLPLIQHLGFNPIWFGVFVVLMVESALITPPVGVNVFIIAAADKDVPVMTIFRGASPFVISIAVAVIIISAFPQIVMVLPNTMVK